MHNDLTATLHESALGGASPAPHPHHLSFQDFLRTQPPRTLGLRVAHLEIHGLDMTGDPRFDPVSRVLVQELNKTRVTVGRGPDCDVRIDFKQLSRVQFTLYFHGSRVFIKDGDPNSSSKSANGTSIGEGLSAIPVDAFNLSEVRQDERISIGKLNALWMHLRNVLPPPIAATPERPSELPATLLEDTPLEVVRNGGADTFLSPDAAPRFGATTPPDSGRKLVVSTSATTSFLDMRPLSFGVAPVAVLPETMIVDGGATLVTKSVSPPRAAFLGAPAALPAVAEPTTATDSTPDFRHATASGVSRDADGDDGTPTASPDEDRFTKGPSAARGLDLKTKSAVSPVRDATIFAALRSVDGDDAAAQRHRAGVAANCSSNSEGDSTPSYADEVEGLHPQIQEQATETALAPSGFAEFGLVRPRTASTIADGSSGALHSHAAPLLATQLDGSGEAVVASPNVTQHDKKASSSTVAEGDDDADGELAKPFLHRSVTSVTGSTRGVVPAAAAATPPPKRGRGSATKVATTCAAPDDDDVHLVAEVHHGDDDSSASPAAAAVTATAQGGDASIFAQVVQTGTPPPVVLRRSTGSSSKRPSLSDAEEDAPAKRAPRKGGAKTAVEASSAAKRSPSSGANKAPPAPTAIAAAEAPAASRTPAGKRAPATPAPTAAPPAAPKVEWQFKSDLRRRDDVEAAWSPYSAADSAIIEAGYLKFKPSGSTKVNNRAKETKLNDTYGVFFPDMVQFRFDDRMKQRPVRRVQR